MKYKLFDSGTELATVSTNPFAVDLTEEGESTESLGEYQTPEEILMMDGETGPDGELSLEEDWIEADEDMIQTQLSRLATLNGWNIVPKSELTDA